MGWVGREREIPSANNTPSLPQDGSRTIKLGFCFFFLNRVRLGEEREAKSSRREGGRRRRRERSHLRTQSLAVPAGCDRSSLPPWKPAGAVGCRHAVSISPPCRAGEGGVGEAEEVLRGRGGSSSKASRPPPCKLFRVLIISTEGYVWVRVGGGNVSVRENARGGLCIFPAPAAVLKLQAASNPQGKAE